MVKANSFLRLVVLFVQQNTILAQSCSSPGHFDNVQNDVAITGSSFRILTGVGLVGCSKQCLLRQACHSFNYEPSTQECQLNRNSSTTTDEDYLVNSVGTLSSDRSRWPSLIAGVCSAAPCPDNSVCVENGFIANCETECPDPVLQKGTFTSAITHAVGSTLTFECDAGLTATGRAQCQENGTWTSFSCGIVCVNQPIVLYSTSTQETSVTPGTVLQYECISTYVALGKVMCKPDGTWTDMQCVKKVTDCSQLSQCLNQYMDEEYWLYPLIFYDKPVKIYCHGMTSGAPLEYVTLPEENYVDYSDTECDPTVGTRKPFTGCESVRFNKLRITDISQMSTDSNGLKDFQFVNTSAICYYSQFGNVNDCHAQAECKRPKTRDYVINTKGTGVKVSSLQGWSAQTVNPDLLVIDPITIIKEDNGRKITVECHQDCKWCYPNGDTYQFEIDSEFVIDISSAVVPDCL